MDSRSNWFPTVILALVLTAGCTQAAVLLADYGIPWAKATWRTRNLPAVDRSARFLFGSTGMEYMRFLRQVVPEGTSVAVPDAAGAFSAQNNLQFFLMPRAIVACPCMGAKSNGWTAECAVCLQSPGMAVPAIKEFPPPQVMDGFAVLRSFPGNSDVFRGVYLPGGAGQDAGVTESRAAGDLMTDPRAVLRSGIVMLLVGLLGALAARLLFGESSWMGILTLSVPVGLGLLTWCTFVVAWILGGRIGIWTFIAVYLAIVGGALSLALGRSRFRYTSLNDAAGSGVRGARRLRISVASLTVTATCLLLLLSVAISIGRAYSIYDDIANWALKGYATSQFGSIFAGKDWGGHVLAYPQNVPLGIAIFRMVDGDALPGSKLIFPAFLASLVSGCMWFWRRQGASPQLAAAGGLALVSLPVLFFHSTTGYANLPYTTYLVLGALWTASGLESCRPARVRIGSLLFGLAAWTRPEGFGFALAGLGLLWLTGSRRRLAAGTVANLALPFLIVSGMWLAFGTTYQVGEEIGGTVRTFVSSLVGGTLDPEGAKFLAGYAARAFLAPTVWGAWMPLLAILAIAAILGGGRPRQAMVVSTGALGLCWLFGVLAMLYTAQPSHPDFKIFLDFSFDRAAFPGAVLLLWAALAASGGATRMRLSGREPCQG